MPPLPVNGDPICRKLSWVCDGAVFGSIACSFRRSNSAIKEPSE